MVLMSIVILAVHRTTPGSKGNFSLSWAGAPGADGVGELAQDRHGVVPGETGVGDALSVGERLAGLGILAATDQVTPDHHAAKRAPAYADLGGQIARHRRLALRILAAVAVAAVDHQARPQ